MSMMGSTSNQPPRIGHNTGVMTPEEIIASLGSDYTDLQNTANTLIADASLLVGDVTEANLGEFTSCFVQLRDGIKDAEAYRIKEKDPYLQGERAVDSFFSLIKANMSKAMVSVSKKVDAYQQAKLAAERARRARELREAQEKEAEAARVAAAARKPVHQETKAAAAEVAAVELDNAIETAKAKPAEMTRERTETGQLTTMRQEGFAEVTDWDALDLVALKPYLARDAIEKALMAYARINKFEPKAALAGTAIGMRDRTVIR